jgi:hypothetical protein
VNRTVTALTLVLLIQCGIVAVVFWPERAPPQESTRAALAPFQVDAVRELHIGDEFDNEAMLVRSGEQWLLPDLENLPADPVKVEALLHSITNQGAGWPIAHTAAARQRFQVSDYYYQRRLTLLSDGETLGTIFLGTSPGFRKVHARNEAQNDIYSITLNTFDVPAINDAWLEPRLLQVRAPLRIDADLYNIYFENGNWLSATGGTPNEEELEALLAALRSLQVDGIADEDLQRELAATEADLVLNIQGLAGKVTLELVTLNGAHYIHSSEFPLFFELSAYDFDQLTGVDSRLIAGEKSSD